MEGRDQVLLDVLRSLAEERRQARVTHAYRVVKRFGLPIRTRAEVDAVISFREFLDLCEVYNPNADSTRRKEQFLEQQEDLIKQRPMQPVSVSNMF